MARYLSIDWDHDRFYVVSVTGGRGSVRLEKAAAWNQPHTLDLATLEGMGQALRQRLKAASIAPAPVLACLGRERVIFKEVRHPPVAASEEPALIRFQVTKELTEPANNVLIDYTPSPNGTVNGERKVTVSVARKPWTNALETICKAAGLKLQAITPRPFGVAACLQYLDSSTGLSAPPPAPGMLTAVVVLARAWAEFSIVRDGQVLFARSLPVGEELLGDVRRNLALFSGQMHIKPGSGDTVQALYFSGAEEHIVVRERLEEMLAIPVYNFDPFGGVENIGVPEDRAGFCGAAGFGQLWAEQQSAPINFLKPKQAEVKTGANNRLYILAGVLAAVVLIGAFLVGNYVLAQRQNDLDSFNARLASLTGTVKRLEPEAKKVDQLKDWKESALCWINELHDLTHMFPQEEDFKVNKIRITELQNSKDPQFTMQMRIYGVVPSRKANLVDKLVHIINQDKYAHATPSGEGEPGRESSDLKKFSITVNLAKEPEQLVTTTQTSPGQTKITPRDSGKKQKMRRPGRRK